MTPEELIRQTLLQKMIEHLGYPKELIAIERKIPHLRRRADLICYTNQIDPQNILPLLVVECKAKRFAGGEKALQQLLGYNSALGAPFLSLADEEGEETFWLVGEEMKSVPFMPSYRELCQRLKK